MSLSSVIQRPYDCGCADSNGGSYDGRLVDSEASLGLIAGIASVSPIARRRRRVATCPWNRTKAGKLVRLAHGMGAKKVHAILY